MTLAKKLKSYRSNSILHGVFINGKKKLRKEKVMKRNIKKTIFLSITILLSVLSSNIIKTQDTESGCSCSCTCPTCDYCFDCIKCCDEKLLCPCDGYPFIAYRSQSFNKAKELCGFQPYMHKYNKDKLYVSLYTSLEYSRSFRPSHIAKMLFGDDLVNADTLIIQGSTVENRNPKAWLADYFGLPTDFHSIVKLRPTIQNVILDFNIYFGLENVSDGLYFKLYFPVVHSLWDLKAYECVIDSGKEPFEKYYMGIDEIPREKLPTQFMCAMQGETIFTEKNDEGETVKFGDLITPMYFGIIPMCRLKKTRLADIRATLGWDFFQRKDFHMGVNIHAAAPTGSRPEGIYLFEPQIGNGKHWELGAGFTWSLIFWRSQNSEDKYAGIWFDATVTHMFKTCQKRSFDFCCKPNSRYMLLTEMTKGIEGQTGTLEAEAFVGVDPVSTTTTEAKFVYNRNLVPGANYTTRSVDVKINVQSDIAIKIGYKGEDFSFDIGYELWARTGEQFSQCKDFCKNEPSKIYVMKGDSIIYGTNMTELVLTDTKFKPGELNVPLTSSQRCANIHTGQNMQLDPVNAALNKGVDNPLPISLAATIPYVPLGKTAAGPQLYSSFQPIRLTTDDINTCKSPSAVTHKLFGHMNYSWEKFEKDWRPFVGIGGEVEFAHKTLNIRAISQWGMWIKAGVAYN